MAASSSLQTLKITPLPCRPKGTIHKPTVEQCLTLTIALALREACARAPRAPRAPSCQARPFRRLPAPGICSRLLTRCCLHRAADTRRYTPAPAPQLSPQHATRPHPCLGSRVYATAPSPSFPSTSLLRVPPFAHYIYLSRVSGQHCYRTLAAPHHLPNIYISRVQPHNLCSPSPSPTTPLDAPLLWLPYAPLAGFLLMPSTPNIF